MSTQVTEAHRKLAADLCRHATGSNRALHHVPKFAQLIADSEARALAAAVTALTCTHHNDQQREECPVCLVTQLRAELSDQAARFHDEIVSRQGTVRANQELGLKELNHLRADLDAIKAILNEETNRADKAEAVLLDPQQLHAHCLRNLNEGQIAHLFGERMTEIVNRAARAEENLDHLIAFDNGMHKRYEADLATERARLDYLSTRGFEHRHGDTGDHLVVEWTISSHNELKDVSLREVIDAAMKEAAK